MDKTFSYDYIRGRNGSLDAHETIEVAAALTNGPLTNDLTVDSIFNQNSRLFIPAAPSPLGSGDVASNFRDKHDKMKNNSSINYWIKLFKNYSQKSRNPVYVTAVSRKERRYTLNLPVDGSLVIIDNNPSGTSIPSFDFTSFMKSFNIENEQMKIIREASSGAKFNTYFADLIGLMNMVNQDYHPEMFDNIWLKINHVKENAVDDSGVKLLQPVKSSGRTWTPIEGHDYLYFEQSEEKCQDSIKFNILKDDSMNKVYEQISQLISLEENGIKEMVRKFFLNQATYIRWSDFWVNDIDDALSVLSVINAFNHVSLNEDEIHIKRQFEEIAKPWFLKLHI